MNRMVHRGLRFACAALPLVSLAACGDRDSGLGGASQLDAVVVAEPVEVTLGEFVRLDGGGSHDSAGVEARFSDSSIDEFRFDFGDGAGLTTELAYVDHVYTAVGEYSVTLTVVSGDDEASGATQVTVKARPPVIVAVDVSADEVAVIGEWIALRGRGFREDNVPEVSFDGVAALNVSVASEYEVLIQVPTTTLSGWNDLLVDFPQDDEGDDVFVVWVARFALATDAWRGAVYVVEFGQADQYWPRTQSIEVDNAAVVRVSADGAFALVGDARYQATLSPSVTVVDLTADWQPVVVAELSGLGVGPLFDIAIAADRQRAVVSDATGFVVLDLSDPTNPTPLGDREVYAFANMAPTALALSPDGSRLAVLSTFTERLRFYSITATGPIYETWSVDVGPGTQDLAVAADGTLVVLGGGGEGAIPPDFSLDNTTLTLVDMNATPPLNVHGDGSFLSLGSSAPIPIDLALGSSGRAYVSTLDSNISDILDAFGGIAANPVNVSSWWNLVESLAGQGFGSVLPVDGIYEGQVVIGDGLFSAFGFQAGVGLRPDEHLYVSTVIGLGWTLEVLTGDNLAYLSLDLDYGVGVGNLLTGEVEIFPMYSEPIVSYIDFQLNYDLGPLTALLLPPYAFGDVAVQP
jgi:PKD repeat protein